MFLSKIFKRIRHRKYKIIRPDDFLEVDSLADSFGKRRISRAVQIISSPIEVTYPKFKIMPFSWHETQRSILVNQASKGRNFSNYHTPRKSYVSYMRNVKLLGGVVIDAKLNINSDTIYHYFGKRVDFEGYLSKPRRTIQEPVFYLGETKEYFHWIMDCLTAISFWRKLGLDRKVKLFVANITDFKRQSLLAYGIPSEMVIGDEIGHVNFKHIFVPSTLGGGQAWTTPKYLPKFHRESVVDIIPEVTGMKYYISRSRTDRRPINNEEEVEKMLIKLGFKVLFLEEYPFEEQIRLMKSASLIVSPHGAGLTNIVYCAPETIVIELLCERYLNCCFYKLSSMSNLTYMPLVSTSYEVTGDHLHDHNWDVNISKLRQAISFLSKA